MKIKILTFLVSSFFLLPALVKADCSVPKTVVKPTGAYICPTGENLNTSTCSFASTVNYSCPLGGTRSGTTCTKSSSYAATVNYSCPLGGTRSGTTCTKSSSYAATVNYSCPLGGTRSGTTCTKSSSYSAALTVPDCPSDTHYQGGDLTGIWCLSLYTSKLTHINYGPYYCPYGGSVSGNMCIKSSSYAATANYSCPLGGSRSGTTCTTSSSYAATVNYSCPLGGTRSGTTCTTSSSYAATPAYSCPVGTKLSSDNKRCEHSATPTYDCSQKCSEQFSYTQMAFVSTSPTCAIPPMPLGAINYTKNCECGEKILPAPAVINTSTCSTCIPNFTLSVSAGTNTTIKGPGINLFSSSDDYSFPSGTPIELEASAASGSTLKDWEGGTCSGSASIKCNFSMTKNISVSTYAEVNTCKDTCATTDCKKSCLKSDCTNDPTGGKKNCPIGIDLGGYREVAP